MSRHDANRLTYDEVTIFGVPALFTDLRVDRSTVPDGVYRYEVRYSDEYGGEPVELARGIMVDFFGTVLMREPIQLPISGGMELNDGDLDFQSGCFSLAEFQQKYPLSEKQVIDFFIADDTALHDFCYSQSEEQDKTTGCIGHLRGDFGSGKQFYTTWWPHQADRLNTPEFSHVWLLLYWPLFGLGFSYVERFYPVAHYINMHCALDDLIPFNEWFLIPYLFWFVYLIGAVAYTFFFDVPGFRRMMRFVMITYSVTLIIYFLFPTCQMLRPEVFPRDNALTRFIAGFYVFDTNTNVCPSLHVIGSMAAFFAFWYAPIFSKRGWRIASTVAAFFISISTVFMKQHSILDVAAAIPLCAIGYYFAYVRTPKKSRSAVPDATR